MKGGITITWDNPLQSDADVAVIRNICLEFATLDGLKAELVKHLGGRYAVYRGDNHIAIMPIGSTDRSKRHVLLTDGIEI